MMLTPLAYADTSSRIRTKAGRPVCRGPTPQLVQTPKRCPANLSERGNNHRSPRHGFQYKIGKSNPKFCWSEGAKAALARSSGCGSTPRVHVTSSAPCMPCNAITTPPLSAAGSTLPLCHDLSTTIDTSQRTKIKTMLNIQHGTNS
jgi:hypothetical protein